MSKNSRAGHSTRLAAVMAAGAVCVAGGIALSGSGTAGFRPAGSSDHPHLDPTASPVSPDPWDPMPTVAPDPSHSVVPARGGATSPDLTKVCAAAQKRNGVVHCTSLFPGRKPIRLPGDPSRTQRYGALKRGGRAFYTRTGDLRLTAAVAEQLNTSTIGGRVTYANTIYLATVSRGAVTKLKPVITVDENAVLRATFAGRAMEGTISARTGQGAYASRATLPIRIAFAASPVGGRLAGTITNATERARSAAGSCLPALNRTAKNPLVGEYTAKIQIQRFPAMHAMGDDELVLAWSDSASNMGSAYYPSLATLLGGDPIGRTWETRIHGTPSVGPPVNLHLVKGGGGTC